MNGSSTGSLTEPTMAASVANGATSGIKWNVCIPPLENGDRLTRPEFERRYEAMLELKKAELLEGIVYMPSPVRYAHHGKPHNRIGTWLGIYEVSTPGVEAANNASARLDLDNEPQPDNCLIILPACGGQTRISNDDHIEGAPELGAEVTSSSVSYDLGVKLQVYRRSGVLEYVVWRTLDQAIDWFVLREGNYDRLGPDADGLLKSQVFPGLWLDDKALIAGDMARVLAIVQQGIASPEHAAFIAKLQAARSTSK